MDTSEQQNAASAKVEKELRDERDVARKAAQRFEAELTDARNAHDATRAELVAVRGTLADLVAAAPDVVEALCEATEHIDRKADNEPAGILQVDEKIYAREIKTRGDALTAAVERARQVL